MDASARHARVKSLFLEALEQPREGRREFVRGREAEEQSLVHEVLSLLDYRIDESVIRTALPPPSRSALTAAPRPDPLSLRGTTVEGRYLVEEFVDEGGFSYVYRALHVFWRKPVALKFFKEDARGASLELQDAFIREGAIMNGLALGCSSIVQSFDVGTCTTPAGKVLLYTALEWLEGETLAAVIKRDRANRSSRGWPIERVIAVLSPIVEALAFAHDAGVAHRDVKPSNIFLLQKSEGATAKLLDFGIAKVAGAKGDFLTTGGVSTACTLKYAAPEQLARSYGPTGPWSDVYALAMVAVELLHGDHPFQVADLGAAVQLACDPSSRPTPRTVGARVSARVEEVFRKALSVKAEERFANARQFWTALLQANAVTPQEPETKRDAAGREARRTAMLVGAVSLAALLLVGVGYALAKL